MTDTLDPTLPPPPEGDRTEPVDIQQEMQRSYIDYAMSVIVGRALPLVEDGLKPVAVVLTSWAVTRLTRGRVRPPVGWAAVIGTY